MRERLARSLELVETIGDRVARNGGDPRLPALVVECAGNGIARALRVEPAGIHHELDAVLGRHRP
jgi:hypothetical protein